MTNFTDVDVTSLSVNGVAQTATPAEVNALAGVTAGTVTASKALVVDSNKDLASLRNLTLTGFLFGSATNTITAFAGGGQGSAVALTTGFNRITVCATAADSVKLPAATAGKEVKIKNNGVAYASIFPASGEVIDTLAANTSVSLPSAGTITFYCVVAGTWESSKLQPLAVKNTATTLASATFAAGTLTGADLCVAHNTNETPGTLTTRTATEMFVDDPFARIGRAFVVRIMNQASVNNLTFALGSGVTGSASPVVPAAGYNDYMLVYTSATAATCTYIGGGTGI